MEDESNRRAKEEERQRRLDAGEELSDEGGCTVLVLNVTHDVS